MTRNAEPVSKTAGLESFVGWDIRNWSAALEFWQAHTKQQIRGCSAMELGSQDGGLSLWLALQGARVVCSDIGPPNRNAMKQHEAGGVSQLIQYRSIDALDIPYQNEFDIVMFKSVLGAVGISDAQDGFARQAKAIDQIHRALKVGGELFFAENLLASPVHRFLRRRFVQWGSAWRYVSIQEMKRLLAPFSTVHYRTLGFAGAFGRGETQRKILGAVDQAVLNRVTPEKWRYIIVGVARK